MIKCVSSVCLIIFVFLQIDDDIETNIHHKPTLASTSRQIMSVRIHVSELVVLCHSRTDI